VGAPYPEDTDKRVLTPVATVATYLGILATIFAVDIPLYVWFKVDLYRAAAVSLGVVYALAVVRRPWWLFFVIRSYWTFARMDEDLVRILCGIIAVVLVGGGLFWHPPTTERVSSGQCRQSYQTAVTLQDTLRVDRLFPTDLGRMIPTNVGRPSMAFTCGALRRHDGVVPR
jgi:hypothetical protein